jgi:hypothetical protein
MNPRKATAAKIKKKNSPLCQDQYIHPKVVVKNSFIIYTRPRAKPLAILFLTKYTKIAPGMMVNTPAAAKSPHRVPSDEVIPTVKETTIGRALVVVTALAINISTHEKVKLKKAVIPIPGPIRGKKIFMKKRGKLYPSTSAVSSISGGIPDMKPSRIHIASGILNRQCPSATARVVSKILRV